MKSRWIFSLILMASLVFVPSTVTNAAPPAIVPTGGGLSFLHGVITVVGSDTAPNNSFGAQRVLCPDGMVAIGGGIDLDNVLTMQVSSSGPVYAQNNARLLFQPDGSNPAPVGWQASAVNHSGATAGLKVAVTCAPISGVTSMVSSAIVPGNSFNVATANCPAGTVAYSGGIDQENVFTMTVSSSGPTFGVGHTRLLATPDGNQPAPTGWWASGINFTATQSSFKVAVICGPNPGIITVVGSGTAGANTFDAQRLTCPASTIDIGGGIDPNNVLTMQVSSSAPTFAQNNNRLLFQPNGINPMAVGWQASIVNTELTPRDYKIAAICSLVSYWNHLPYIVNLAN